MLATFLWLTFGNIMSSIEVVLKIAERCNINCSYCYMFNLGNEDYKNNPKFISESTIDDLVYFLEKGVFELKLNKIDLIFHGGEPLLIGTRRFSTICDLFKSKLGDLVKLNFSVQTNAILVNENWIKVFNKFNVSVGVSLDGPENYNDVHRLDHQGKGTYKKTIRGLNLLQSAAKQNLVPPPGVLIVIDPNVSGKAIYEHIVGELNVKSINFLLPMIKNELPSESFNHSLSRYLNEIILSHLVNGGHEKSKLRIINQFASYLKFGYNKDNIDNASSYILAVSSGGQLDVDDEFKTIENKYSSYNLKNSSMKDFIYSEYYQSYYDIPKKIPFDCLDCCWKNYCVGGAGVGASLSRYREGSGFNNRSLFCESLKSFYANVSALMLKSGLERVTRNQTCRWYWANILH